VRGVSACREPVFEIVESTQLKNSSNIAPIAHPILVVSSKGLAEAMLLQEATLKRCAYSLILISMSLCVVRQ
jgi:hypothetical protein